MRVLALSEVFPYPPVDGRRIPVYHVLRQLGTRHEIDLLAFTEPSGPLTDEQVRHMGRICGEVQTVPQARLNPARIAANMFEGRPLSLARYRTAPALAGLAARLRERRYDLVHAFGFNVGQFMPAIRGHQALPGLWAPNDCVSLGARRMIGKGAAPWVWRQRYRLEMRRIARYERKTLRQFDAAYVVSPVDRDAMKRLSPEARVEVITNGVDIGYFAPREEPGPDGPAPIVMTGTLSGFREEEAVTFVRDAVLPALRRMVPEVRLVLAGGFPGPALRRLAAGIPGVEVTGFVGDLRPFLAAAVVYICPLRRGGGVKNRLLEALAMGKAAVSTSVGTEGLAVTHGKELLIADEPADFAGQVARLLQQPDLRHQLGLAARRFIEAHHSWDLIARQVNDLYEAVRSGPRRHA